MIIIASVKDYEQEEATNGHTKVYNKEYLYPGNDGNATADSRFFIVFGDQNNDE